MLDMRMLEDAFLTADQRGCSYLGVEVHIGDSSVEYIIVKRNDFASKLKYYKNAYTEELKLKANNDISIVDVAYADTFDDIERHLTYKI